MIDLGYYCVGASLLFLGYQAIKKGTTMAEKPRLNFQVSFEEEAAFKTLAKAEGKTLSTWLRERLLRSMSPQERASLGSAVAPVIEEAAQLDNLSDGYALPGVIPPPPAQAQPVRNLPIVGQRSLPLEKDPMYKPSPHHSCAYLSLFKTSNLATSSEGTCLNPEQHGRVCFWASTTASQCMKFSPKGNPGGRGVRAVA